MLISFSVNKYRPPLTGPVKLMEIFLFKLFILRVSQSMTGLGTGIGFISGHKIIVAHK